MSVEVARRDPGLPPVDDPRAAHHVAPAPPVRSLDQDRVAVAQAAQEREVRVAVAADHGVARARRARGVPSRWPGPKAIVRPLAPASTKSSSPAPGTTRRATGCVSAHGHGRASRSPGPRPLPRVAHQVLRQAGLRLDPGGAAGVPRRDREQEEKARPAQVVSRPVSLVRTVAGRAAGERRRAGRRARREPPARARVRPASRGSGAGGRRLRQLAEDRLVAPAVRQVRRRRPASASAASAGRTGVTSTATRLVCFVTRWCSRPSATTCAFTASASAPAPVDGVERARRPCGAPTGRRGPRPGARRRAAASRATPPARAGRSTHDGAVGGAREPRAHHHRLARVEVGHARRPRLDRGALRPAHVDARQHGALEPLEELAHLLLDLAHVADVREACRGRTRRPSS